VVAVESARERVVEIESDKERDIEIESVAYPGSVVLSGYYSFLHH
jgi:hypothetical protein